MFQEYPKCLIRGEVSIVVFDAAQEEAARADGYQFHDEVGQEAAPVRNKPGRKPKAD